MVRPEKRPIFKRNNNKNKKKKLYIHYLLGKKDGNKERERERKKGKLAINTLIELVVMATDVSTFSTALHFIHLTFIGFVFGTYKEYANSSRIKSCCANNVALKSGRWGKYGQI